VADGLYFVVHTFDGAVGEPQLRPGQNTIEMIPKHAYELLKGFQARPHGGVHPFLQVLSGPGGLPVFPEELERFLEVVSTDDGGVPADQRRQAFFLVCCQIPGIFQQQPAAPLEGQTGQVGKKGPLRNQTAPATGSGMGRNGYAGGNVHSEPTDRSTRSVILMGHRAFRRGEMVRHWMLSDHDLEVVNERRQRHNRLGFGGFRAVSGHSASREIVHEPRKFLSGPFLPTRPVWPRSELICRGHFRLIQLKLLRPLKALLTGISLVTLSQSRLYIVSAETFEIARHISSSDDMAQTAFPMQARGHEPTKLHARPP